ncbi:conjugal transfer protein TraI [Alistipes shahii]|uniref:conjugal transfer protein TraI n=1 Tax=Alistipes shahii TaxID=328814 RepID=UPI003AF0D6B5
MNRLILLVESRIRGDVYVRFGGELPKTHRSNTAGRWMLSLPLKSVSNLVRSARKVQQCILLVGEISDIYVDGYRRMVGDENFTPAELAAIAAGYARIIEESAGELKELQDIVNPTDMSLTDKDRIDVVQRVYGVLRRHRDLARYYTRKNISISLLRAARKRDMEGVLSLYGTDEQRYW